MELCVRELAPQISLLKEKGVSLACVRTCVVVAEERPRVALCAAFSKLFAPLGLNSRAVSTSFGCRVLHFMPFNFRLFQRQMRF